MRDPASESVTFRLKALHPGPEPKSQTITAEFWTGNNALGEVTHATMIVPLGYSGSVTPEGRTSATTVRVSSARREDCDLAIKVRRQGVPQAVHCDRQAHGLSRCDRQRSGSGVPDIN
jgi:hypothetical protein